MFLGVNFLIFSLLILDTVTNIADRKSRQALRKTKKINKDGIVIAMGCYIQADKNILDKDVDIDITIGTDDKEKVFEIVQEYIKNK